MNDRLSATYQTFTTLPAAISNPWDRYRAKALSNLLAFLLLMCLAGFFFPQAPHLALLVLSPVLLACYLLIQTARWRLAGWIAFVVLSLMPFIGLANLESVQGNFISPLIFLALPSLIASFLLDMFGIIVVFVVYSTAVLTLPIYLPAISPSQAWYTFQVLITITIFTFVAVRRRDKNLYDYGRSKERAESISTLEASEKKYRDLFNLANDTILVVDPRTFTILDINDNSLAHFGFPPNEMIGSHVDTLLSPVNDEQDTFISDNLESSQQTVFEACLNHKNGSEIPVEFSSRLVEYEGRTIYHCIVRDIRERKSSEEQLRQYSERLETLHQIELAMLSVQSPEEIADVALNRLRQAVNCRRASLARFSYASQEVLIVGVDEEDISGDLPQPGARLPFEDIRISDKLQDGDHHQEDDIAHVKYPKRLESLMAEAGINSYISLPVFIQGELWGILNLVGPRSTSNFSNSNIEVAMEAVRLVAVAIQQTNLFREIRLGRARLQALSRQLVEAQEAERRHIANELHDEIGQALTGINLSLETHIRSQDEEANLSALLEAQKTTEELIARVQAISLDLRPAMLDDLGLLPTLTWHFDRYESQTGIKVNFEHRRLNERFSPEIETAAYRILQEALTNVARHSNVREVKVHASLENDVVLLFMEDRGGGFSVEKALMSGSASGLVGMRERALSLGGDLTIISTQGSGSQILAKLPLHSRIERRTAPRDDDQDLAR